MRVSCYALFCARSARGRPPEEILTARKPETRKDPRAPDSWARSYRGPRVDRRINAKGLRAGDASAIGSGWGSSFGRSFGDSSLLSSHKRVNE